jgi:bifunctional NMN adenylyltransferase/nudix hydrolase
MKNYKYTYSVFIGRFQPYHVGHEDTIKKALEISKELIIVLGSYNTSRNIKNPFSCEERQEMIELSLSDNEKSRVHFKYVEDRLYQENEWIKKVQEAVLSITLSTKSVAIVGLEKDESTYYLKHFKNWKHEAINVFKNGSNEHPISSTKIRELIFTGNISYIESNVPNSTYQWLINFSKSEIFKSLKQEYEHAVQYEKIYEQFPYTANFVTVDTVVVQSGHILLIQRKDAPGKGLWALPGGHVGTDETLLSASIRELKEETKINIQEDVLYRCVVDSEIFDHPERSLRARISSKKGRSITKAFCIKLNDDKDLPKVKGSDDASKAWWFPFAEVSNMRNQLFEDHADIIDYFISRI